MVKQGDIIKTDFDPTRGHEQAGYRPALVISNDLFNRVTNMTLVCPISTKKHKNPLHIKLPASMQTKGYVMTEHVRAVDLRERKYSVTERASYNITEQISNLLKASVDIPGDI